MPVAAEKPISISIEELAYSKLLCYISMQNPNYKIGIMHETLAEYLEALERGDIDRLMVFAPPRHGKSDEANVYFPPWVMGRNPDWHIISTSYSQTKANDVGRKVRNQLDDKIHQAVFPDCRIADDMKSIQHFSTEQGGEYYSMGVCGTVVGRGGKLIIIDDPIKDRASAESKLEREKLRAWYRGVAYTRLAPKGRILLINCVTGSTMVTMADGSKRKIKDINVGDYVASFSKGKIVPSQVTNWANQGMDDCYTLKTKSGASVTANDRHPFLIKRNGKTLWMKLKNIQVSDVIFRVNGESGKINCAKPMDVNCQQNVEDSATVIITSGNGRVGTGLRLSTQKLKEKGIFDIDIKLILKNLIKCSRNKIGNVLYAVNCQGEMFERIGAENCVLTTATSRGMSGGCSAMTAIWSSDMAKTKKLWSQPLDTFEIAPDIVTKIEVSPREDVFDIEVAGTENFIANGLITHNTRWHEDDLSGWQLKEFASEGWVVLNMPAIAEDNDILGRQPGEALWPEAYPLEALGRIRTVIGSYEWNAQYQQRPVSAEGSIVKHEWLRKYDTSKDLPQFQKIVLSCDTAFKATELADPTAILVWGVTKNEYYLLDVLCRRMEFHELKRAITMMYQKWSASACLVEDRSSGQSLIQEFKRISPIPVIPIKTMNVDKVTRFSSVSHYFESGAVLLPTAAPWLVDYESQITSFPYDKHDDMVDATSQFLIWCAKPRYSFSLKPLFWK
jgi:predicted phage terminase large subunit-like protein